VNLIAGFYVGEFGHLLFKWQGIIRHVAKGYEHVTIGCEKPFKFCFEDFADDFLYFEDTGIEIKSRNMWMANGRTYNLTNANFHPSREICLSNGKYHQDFIKWGEKIPFRDYNILIHARATKNYDTEYRNWPVKQWDCIVKHYKGMKIGSIGSKDGAYHIQDTDDLRDIPLKELADVMASSKILVSPSSGPVHFASLCGLAHIVWSSVPDRGLMDNRYRYVNSWNPFNTPVTFIDTWQPDPLMIIKEVDKCLSL
jgi:hypothetical protein